MTSKAKENVGFIASLIAILAFFGYPTISSFFETNKEPKNQKVKTFHPIDENLVGVWEMKDTNSETKYTGNLTENFYANGTGITSLTIDSDDFCELHCLAKCPFTWKTYIKSDSLRGITLKYGIPEIIKFESKALFKPLYENTKHKLESEFTKKTYKAEYILQGDFLYIEKFDTINKVNLRYRFIRKKD